MKVVELTKEYFKLEDGTVIEHFMEIKELPSLDEFQKIYDNMQKFIGDTLEND